jgi:hypothetical protein
MGRSVGVMLVPWVLVLVQCVRTEDYSGLRGAVRHVEDAIRKEMMIEPVRYSEPNLSLTYRASTDFNARGMANLYKVTNFFMDIIQREDPYPEGKSCFINLTSYKKKLAVDQLVEILYTFYIG